MKEGAFGKLPLPSPAMTLGVAGLIIGVLAKIIDGMDVPVATDLVANLGSWILVMALLGATSPSRLAAVGRIITFLLTMLVGYFSISAWFFDYMPWSYALEQVAVTLVLGPPFALIAWYSRGTGWAAALTATIPAGMLLFWWLPFLFLQSGATGVHIPVIDIVSAFNLVAGGVLLVVLPHGNRQRLRAFALATPMGLVIAFTLISVAR